MRRLTLLLAFLAAAPLALAQNAFSPALPPFPYPTPNVLTAKHFVTGGTGGVGGSSITFAQLDWSEAPYTAVRACWENTLSTAATIDGVMFAPSAAPNDNINPVTATGAAGSFTAAPGVSSAAPITIPASTNGGYPPGIACSPWTTLASIPRTDIPGAPPLVMARSHTATNTSAGAPTPTVMSVTSGQPLPISSGSYNSTTGVVTLSFGTFPNLVPGNPVTITGAAGTGSFAAINGTFTAGTGTATGTITYTIATGLTMTITGGGLASVVAPSVRPVYGYYKSQTLANFATPSTFTSPTNAYISMMLQFQTAARATTLMAIGDSITQGVNSTGAYLAWGHLASIQGSSLTRPVQFLNCGKQGDTTTTGYLARCLPYIQTFSPQVVFISPYSPNDPQTSAQATTDYTQTMALAAQIKASGMQPILWTGIPLGSLSTTNDAYRQSLNANIRTNGLYPVADMDAVTSDNATPSRMLAVCNSGDSTHPTTYCIGLMAAQAYKAAQPYMN